MAEKIIQELETESVESKDYFQQAKNLWDKFNKQIIYVGSAIILLIGGWFAYKYFIKIPNNQKASEVIFPAQKMFGKIVNSSSYGKDTVSILLNGGNFDGQNITGLLKIISNYGSTPSGNLAQYMTGSCYLQLGEFDKAITHLKNFDGNGANQIQSAAYRMLGDAYAEKKNNDEALSYYEKAIGVSSSKDESTRFLSLSRAALFCDATGNTKKAISLYTQIKEEITPAFLTRNGFDADKYLAKLGVIK